jgi:GH15 family glucan-1,4-alpha-glucosidase
LVQSQTPDGQSAVASDGPGGAASWTTGNKLAVGTSAGLDSKVWFTVAKGITSEIGGIGADTTFTLVLGYGGDAATALAAAEGSLAAGFLDRETAYRRGWSDYVDSLRSAPSSVSTDTLRRRVYYTAAMALHAAEDKTFRGGNVAGFGTPWGDFVNGDQPNDGYHRVWGRDLYQQAMG